MSSGWGMNNTFSKPPPKENNKKHTLPILVSSLRWCLLPKDGTTSGDSRVLSMDPSSLTCLNMSTWSVEATRSGVDTGIAYLYFSHTHTYIGIFEYTRKSQFLLVDWIDMSILLLQHPYSLDARPAINKRNIYHHISFKTHETFSFLSSRRQHTPALCKDTWSYHPKRPEKQTTIKAEGQRVRHSSTNKNSGSRQWMQVSPIKVLLYKQCEFIRDYE